MSLFDCDNLLPEYEAGDCLTDVLTKNKIVGIGIITNPSKNYADPAVWAAYTDLASVKADMVVIPSLIGDYDGGPAEKSTEAYGRAEEQIISRKHTVNIDAEFLPKNHPFFNKAQFARNYGIVLIVGNYERGFYSGKTRATIDPQVPITREISKDMKYVVQITWSKKDLITPIEVPQNILELFE